MQARSRPAMPKPRKPSPPTTESPPTSPRLDLLLAEGKYFALRDWGRVILCADEQDHLLSTTDRALVEHAVQRLNALGQQMLFGMVAPTAEQTQVIASAAWVICAHGAMTDTAQRFFRQGQTKGMQLLHRPVFEARKQELDAAIRAEVKAAIRKDDEHTNGRSRYHPIISGHVHKDAATIREAVNTRLGKRELGADTIARHLKLLYPELYPPRTLGLRKK
jgi:hypothetical protein